MKLRTLRMMMFVRTYAKSAYIFEHLVLARPCAACVKPFAASLCVCNLYTIYLTLSDSVYIMCQIVFRQVFDRLYIGCGQLLDICSIDVRYVLDMFQIRVIYVLDMCYKVVRQFIYIYIYIYCVRQFLYIIEYAHGAITAAPHQVVATLWKVRLFLPVFSDS